MKENKLITVGVIGTGRMASARADALNGCEEARLDWVSSRSREKGERFSEEYGAEKVFTDWEEAVREPGTDAVVVTVPNALHREMGVAALEAGKSVLMEYPLATSEEGARELIAAAEESDGRLHVGLTYRLSGKTDRIKKALGRLGQVGFCRSLHCSVGEIIKWYDDKGLLGNIFVGSNIHFIDELIYWFGPPRWVEGGLYEKAEGADIARDAGTVLMKFREGPLAEVTYARGWEEPGLDFRREIIGEEGYLIETDGELKLELPGGEEELDYDSVDSTLEDTRAFLDSVVSDEDPPYTPEDALYAVRVAEAAEQAARENEKVALDEPGV